MISDNIKRRTMIVITIISLTIIWCSVIVIDSTAQPINMENKATENKVTQVLNESEDVMIETNEFEDSIETEEMYNKDWILKEKENMSILQKKGITAYDIGKLMVSNNIQDIANMENYEKAELLLQHSNYIPADFNNKYKYVYDEFTGNYEREKSEVIKAHPHKEFKSYMSWQVLSPRYAQGQFCAQATPDPETAIMMYNNRYVVALGFAYADEVGQEIDIIMESGDIIRAVVGDFKAPEHTCENQSTQRWDGSVVEFIVSSREEAYEVTNGTGSYNGIFPGMVKEFRKVPFEG